MCINADRSMIFIGKLHLTTNKINYKQMKQNHIIIPILLLASSLINGQEKVYYDVNENITKDINLATHYSIMLKSAVGRDSLFNETYFYINGQKKAVSTYLSKYKNGKSISTYLVGEKWEWFENNTVKLRATYNDGELNGEFLTYWPNGIQRRKDLFKKGKLIEGNCYDSIGNKLSKYFPYETMPEFPGGDERLFMFLGKEVKYPVKAQERGIQGRVVTQFFVDTDGRIIDIKIIKNVQDDLDTEAFRVINSMPNWKPGTIEGQKVRVKYVLPINFRLQ